MGSYVETVRGAVAPWECDVVEHFTVAFYFDKLEMATARLFDLLGVAPDSPAAPGLAHGYVRFQRELRSGDVYTVESGVIGAGDGTLSLGHRFLDAGDGALCTTMEVLHRGAVPGDTAPYRVEWDGPENEGRPAVDDDRPWFPTSVDLVQPHEVNWRGELGLTGIVHRFSAASSQIQARFGMTPAYSREQRIGLSTFEFEFRLDAAPRSGDLVTVRSCLAHIGRSSMRFVHRMVDDRTGKTLAELGQMGVHLDKDARRPSAMPPAIAEAGLALTRAAG